MGNTSGYSDRRIRTDRAAVLGDDLTQLSEAGNRLRQKARKKAGGSKAGDIPHAAGQPLHKKRIQAFKA